jgi:Nickel responsive protein SCO4226-like
VADEKEHQVARYIVERTFVDGLEIPTTKVGAKTCLDVVQNNAEEHVTWVTSYVSVDKTKTYCVYDGPTPLSIQRAATANGLPIDSINEVRVLDPYFYTSDREGSL